MQKSKRADTVDEDEPPAKAARSNGVDFTMALPPFVILADGNPLPAEGNRWWDAARVARGASWTKVTECIDAPRISSPSSS
jgi:purine nucleoside permease